MSSSISHLLFHLIFSTKKREPMISAASEKELYAYMGGILNHHKSTMLQIGGTADHLHLLFKLHPSISIAEIVRLLKSNSSKWVNECFKEDTPFAWQTGYGVFSVSESQVSGVRTYIQNQKEHHKKIDFKSELSLLLEKHGVSTAALQFWE